MNVNANANVNVNVNVNASEDNSGEQHNSGDEYNSDYSTINKLRSHRVYRTYCRDTYNCGQLNKTAKFVNVLLTIGNDSCSRITIKNTYRVVGCS